MTRIPASEIAHDDSRPAGWWTSADGQGTIDMRGGSVGSAIAEMLRECGDDEQRADILAGTVEVIDIDAAIARVVGADLEDWLWRNEGEDRPSRDDALAHAHGIDVSKANDLLDDAGLARTEAHRALVYARYVEATERAYE